MKKPLTFIFGVVIALSVLAAILYGLFHNFAFETFVLVVICGAVLTKVFTPGPAKSDVPDSLDKSNKNSPLYDDILDGP